MVRQHARRHSHAGRIAQVAAQVAEGGTVILDPVGGVQTAKLGWTIAGPDGAPNILSELTCKTTTPRGGLNLRWLSETQTFSVDTRAPYGLNVDSDIRDDDFSNNDRQGLFSRSQSSIGGNSVYGIQVQIGRRFLHTERIAVPVTAGYLFD